jgi:GNAT superfamily N-acetyltransferase
VWILLHSRNTFRYRINITEISGYAVSLTTNMISLVNVTSSEARPAAEALARAFYDYPLLKYYYPDNLKREKIASCFFASAVYMGIRSGGVYATSINMEGVAVWMLSDQYPKSMIENLRSIPFSVTYGLFRHGIYKMKAVGDHIDSVKKRLAPPKHMFLQTIGVEPEHRGKGFAGKLINPMLVRLDEEKLPCYLETLDGKNVGLYENFGFRLLDESVVPGTELTSWAMLRETGK